MFKMTEFGEKECTIIGTDGETVGTINTESGKALNVYQTASSGSVNIHFHVDNLTSTPGIYRFILIDVSDTINYKHTGGTNYAHLQTEEVSVKCDINGEWSASIGFLEEVTPTTSKEYVQNHWRGSKDTGSGLEFAINSFRLEHI